VGRDRVHFREYSSRGFCGVAHPTVAARWEGPYQGFLVAPLCRDLAWHPSLGLRTGGHFWYNYAKPPIWQEQRVPQWRIFAGMTTLLICFLPATCNSSGISWRLRPHQVESMRRSRAESNAESACGALVNASRTLLSEHFTACPITPRKLSPQIHDIAEAGNEELARPQT